MYIYAHRGFSGKYPENTMIAFQQAYDLGVDGIELDVQMTKDGELVVIHDERIERTTDGIGYVKDFSYRQLCRFDAGSWFHPRFAGERIPALTDVLDWLANQKRSIVLSIELKNGIIQYDGMEEKLLTLLDSYRLWNHHVIISSFSIQSLYKMRQLAKDINLALLVEGTEQNVLDVARSLNVKEVHVDWTFFISAEGEKVRQEVDTCVYTINEVSLLNKLIGSGVKAIMTDFPDRMIRR